VSRIFILFLFFCSSIIQPVAAQVDSTPNTVSLPPIDTVQAPQVDSARIKDSIHGLLMKDSFSRQPVILQSWAIDSSLPIGVQVLKHHPYFGFGSDPITIHSMIHKFEGKELIFYVLIALLLVFAFLRSAFAKYLNDLFRLFFRTTLKQRQIREQLMQTPLPSLLLNGFFVISGGFYIDFLLLHFGLIEKDDFWMYFLYSGLGLSLVYLAKFLGLKVLGWIFNLREAADSYIFIVFVMNKVIGIFLLPFLLMLAFMDGKAYEVALVSSWFGVGALICYRFILTYAAVRNQVKFNPFHFFLYLCAFEIAPLLLIYKLLLVFFH
jgi:hypothetical protein